MAYFWETEELIEKQKGAQAFIGKIGNRSFEKIIYRCEQCLEDKTLFKIVNGNSLYILCLQCGSLFIIQRYKLPNNSKKTWNFNIKSYRGKGMFTTFLNGKYYFVPLLKYHSGLMFLFNTFSEDLSIDRHLSYISRMLFPRVNIDRNIYYNYGTKRKAKYFLNYLISLPMKEKLKVMRYVQNCYLTFQNGTIPYVAMSKRNYQAMTQYKGYKYEDVKRIREYIKNKGILS